MVHGGADRGGLALATFTILLGALILLGSLVSLYHVTGLSGSEPNPPLTFTAAMIFLFGLYLFGLGIGRIY